MDSWFPQISMLPNHSNSFGYPCSRYDKAHELLGPLLESEDPLSLKDATAIMDAIHVEKGSSWTIEQW